MPQMRQNAVTIETLRLLQKTVEYLHRLPVVPMTRELCREIDEYLSSKEVNAVKQHACADERLASIRIAESYDTVGRTQIQLLVTSESVTVRTPYIQEWNRVDGLATGQSVKFEIQSILELQLPVGYELVTNPDHIISGLDFVRCNSNGWIAPTDSMVGKRVFETSTFIGYAATLVT